MALTSARIILWKHHKTKNGFAAKIRVQNGKAKYVPLNIYSNLEDWDDKAETVLPSHPQYRIISNEIIQRKSKLITEVDYCNKNGLGLEDSYLVIKKGIDQNKDLQIFILQQKLAELQSSGGVGILEFYDTRIMEVKKEGKSTRAFIQCRDEFKKYLREDISLNQINYDFLMKFSQHKLSNGCGRGGLNYYLKNLRTIYKEAQKRPKLGVKQDNPFLDVIKSAPKKPKLLPNKNDLNMLWGYQPPPYSTRNNNFKTRRNIDIFKLQILMGGQDFVDIALIEWKFLKEDRIKMHRYKNRNNTDSVLIDNKISKEGLDIIDLYGDKESDRVFSFIPDPRLNEYDYTQYNKQVTNSLKNCFKNLGIASTIGTKMARFIYRTAAGQTSVKPLAILQIQGHKPEGISYNYQDRLPNKLIDQYHQQILKEIF